jgi:hypothetical protein
MAGELLCMRRQMLRSESSRKVGGRHSVGVNLFIDRRQDGENENSMHGCAVAFPDIGSVG